MRQDWDERHSSALLALSGGNYPVLGLRGFVSLPQHNHQNISLNKPLKIVLHQFLAHYEQIRADGSVVESEPHIVTEDKSSQKSLSSKVENSIPLILHVAPPVWILIRIRLPSQKMV
jgi:hypothetical protein